MQYAVFRASINTAVGLKMPACTFFGVGDLSKSKKNPHNNLGDDIARLRERACYNVGGVLQSSMRDVT